MNARATTTWAFFCVAVFLVHHVMGEDAVVLSGQNEQVATQETTTAQPTGPSFLRMSAIAGAEDDYYVGIVDNRNGDSSLLRIGDVFAGYEVVDIKPESLAVLIRQGEEEFVLYLSGDETLMYSLAEIDEGDEWDASIKPPEPYRSKEDFLKTAGEELGMIEKGAKIPARLTDPVEAKEALRKMAESVGMAGPEGNELKPRTREDFFKEHGKEP